MKTLSGALLLATLTLMPLPARAIPPAAPQATEDQKRQLLQLNQEVAKLANDGNYKGALDKGKKARSLTEKVHGKQSLEYAVILHNLANLQAVLGDLVESADYYQKAISVYEGIPRSEGRRIRLYKEMASLYWATDDLSASQNCFRKAIVLSESVTKLLNNEGVDLLFGQAAVLEKMKRPKEASQVWAHGLDVLNQINGGRIEVVQLPPDALLGRVKKAGYVADQRNVRGTVVVRLSVDNTGAVTEASVVSGSEKINPIALEIARKTTFNPLIFNGSNVKMTGLVTYQFQTTYRTIITTRQIVTVTTIQ